MLIRDEVTSSLDVSVQAGIVALLRRLQAEQGLTMLFITHGLALAATISDITVVLRSGQVVEYRPTGEVLSNLLDPYTQACWPRARNGKRRTSQRTEERRLSAGRGEPARR